MIRFALAVCLLATPLATGSTNTTSKQLITKVRTYETEDGKYQGLIQLETGQYSGINPDDQTTPCQLWTNSEIVFDSALDALVQAHPVRIIYEARGSNLSSCKISSLTVVNARATIEDALQLAKRADATLNTATANHEFDVAMDMFDDDSFIAAWGEGAEKNKGTTVMAQRYDHQMNPDGSAFQVNTASLSGKDYFESVDVTVLSNGHYIVSYDAIDADGHANRKYRIFDQLNAEVKAETAYPSDQTFGVDMIAHTNDSFVAMGINTNNSYTPELQFFDASGNATTTVSTPYNANSANSSPPSLGISQYNNHIVSSWVNDGDTDDSTVLYIYDREDAEVRINRTFGGEKCSYPEATGTVTRILANRNIAVLYCSGEHLYIRFFDYHGNDKISATRINGNDYSLQDFSAIVLNDDSLLVTWTAANGADGDGLGVFGRRISSKGKALTRDMQINNEGSADQSHSQSFESADGDVHVLWVSDHDGNQDLQYTVVGVNQISSGASTFTMVGRVVAHDPENESLSYSLTDNAGGRFTIYPGGIIKVMNGDGIDREVAKKHRIKVRVSDGKNAATRAFTIRVVDPELQD